MTDMSRYRITDVWGTMIGRIEVDTVLIDEDKGIEGEWLIWSDHECKIVGGFAGDRIDEDDGR